MLAARAIFLVAPPIRGKCNSCLGINGFSIRSYCRAESSRCCTLRDAALYITKLPKAKHDADEWQAAMEALLLVAEHGQRCSPASAS
jgi:hypothetical protein